ncbi:MAG: glycerol kinase GlpK [Microscillaceae bacterium]|nr:glycerol kinase GlpK [Microscillaceae bacterium]
MTQSSQYILALDQGTTSSRAILFNHSGEVIAVSQKEFKQYYPQSAWVEHDPQEIWSSQASVATEVLAKANLSGHQIAGIGITNQRETAILWDKSTGEPIYNAIVWQDRRTAQYCDQLKNQGLISKIQEKTGLIIDAYFSATKIKWILDNVAGARQKAEKGEIAFGTVDSWLVWKFSQGEKHLTDVSNASRTMIFNIHTLEWDTELLELFDIPAAILPEVKSCSEIFAYNKTNLITAEIPIAGMAGDQQAALFGQMCTQPGMLKNTYGTGCFMVMNTGNKPFKSQNNLLSTIGWKIGDQVTYALEGSIFIAGAIIQWLRDELGIIKNAAESEKLALQVSDNGGVYLVPALTGLGAPHWDQYARGTLMGLTRGTNAAHITRAALESIAYQVYDVLEAMNADTQIPPAELRVDGGAVSNNFLMQFQADILGLPVVRPKILETTALGAAYFAGLAVGYWKDLDELKSQWQADQTFVPHLEQTSKKHLLKNWEKALNRAKSWIEED